MLKKVLLGLVAVVAGFLIFAATRPNTYHVERFTAVSATPEAVLSVVGDFQRFGEWSPWEKLDPAMKKTFEGEAGQVGASYAWAGNKQVGEGKMTITDIQPDRVTMRLDFIKPWESTSTTSFTAVPDGANTKVTWSMDGTHNFMSKVMGVFMSMDKMIGKDFEAGLARLKPVAEAVASGVPGSAPPPDSATQ
jgi:carbon monoxide dehydrogenase subunit G